MTIARKILSNTFTQVAGKILAAFLSVIIVKFITNFLNVDGYGQYVSVYEFLAFFGILADLGLFTIAVREMAKDEEKTDFIVGNTLSMRLILALGAMGLAILMAFLVPQYKGTYIPIGVAIASIAVFFSILQGTVSSVLQVKLKMQYSAIALILGKILSLGYMTYVIYFAFTEPSPQAFYQLLWAGVIGNTFMLIFTWYFAAKYARIRLLFNFYYWKNTLWKAFPYGIALVLNMICFRIDSILLLLLKGPTEVGLYGVPMKILDILSVIPIFFMNSVLPILTMRLKDGFEQAKSLVQHSFDFLVAMALPILVGAQILAYPLIFVVSSPEFLSRLNEGFYGSDIALRILVVAMAFAFVSTTFTFTLIAIGYQSKLLYISLTGAIFNIISNIIVIPTWGFRGAATTSALSEFLIMICAFLMLKKHFPVRLEFGGTIRIIFSALVMGGVIWGLRAPLYGLVENFNLLILVPLGGIIYFSMLWFTGVINKDRLRIIRGR